MDKTKLFEKYRKDEDRLLLSKLLDKIAFVERTNKIQYTDFLTPVELQILKDVLNMQGIKNYVIFGGTENAQRNIIVIYPNKLETVFELGNFDFNSICSCVRIINNQERYDHKVYLGGLIKLGVKREKIGDIITYENGADIVVDKEIAKFLTTNLTELVRFQKSKVDVINFKDITKKEQEYKDLKIIVSSLRLDNVISELAKTSRAKSLDVLKQERVFINYKNEVKPTKLVQTGDIITVRGKGKFLIYKIDSQTRNGRAVVLVKQYV